MCTSSSSYYSSSTRVVAGRTAAAVALGAAIEPLLVCPTMVVTTDPTGSDGVDDTPGEREEN